MALRALQQLAVDANVIFLGIGLGAEFGDRLPVDQHASSRDQFLGLAARSHSGGGDNFLQAFSGH